jgi:hypothetical protein
MSDSTKMENQEQKSADSELKWWGQKTPSWCSFEGI